jgi:hypothetical protein
MTPKQAELMRCLTACQAALWEVVEETPGTGPGLVTSSKMLKICVERVQELTEEITNG